MQIPWIHPHIALIPIEWYKNKYYKLRISKISMRHNGVEGYIGMGLLASARLQLQPETKNQRKTYIFYGCYFVNVVVVVFSFFFWCCCLLSESSLSLQALIDIQRMRNRHFQHILICVFFWVALRKNISIVWWCDQRHYHYSVWNMNEWN